MGKSVDATEREASIITSKITRKFGDNVAVSGVDLHIEPGEIYGFLGPNGAGKSTLTRMLCTLLPPSSGSATVAGFDIAKDPGKVRLSIGVALQEAALDPKQTGVEMLQMQGRFYGLSKKETRQRMASLRDLIDIGPALEDRVSTYSGGMKRRLDLALALIHNPRVLFLDEPTTGLDPASRSKVWQEVRRLNDDLGMTIFLTTQYLEEADALTDRVGIIDDGRLVAQGTPEELKRAIGKDLVVAIVDGDTAVAREVLSSVAEVERIEINGPEISIAVGNGPAAISPIAVALADVASQIHVRQLEMRTPTLDDVFLSVTGSRITHREFEPDATL